MDERARKIERGDWSEEDAHRYWRERGAPALRFGWPEEEFFRRERLVGPEVETPMDFSSGAMQRMLLREVLTYTRKLYCCSCHLEGKTRYERAIASPYHWRGHAWYLVGSPPPPVTLYLASEDECGAEAYRRARAAQERTRDHFAVEYQAKPPPGR